MRARERLLRQRLLAPVALETRDVIHAQMQHLATRVAHDFEQTIELWHYARARTRSSNARLM
ncbi:MAG: hypothetical protein ACRETX_16840, partial [Steroidobacteraceae bacterium]